MKTKRLILAILGTTLLSTQSFAQLQIEKNYSTVYLQYNPQTNVTQSEIVDGYHGIALGWKKGMSISNYNPLFIESGLSFQCTYCDTEQTNKGAIVGHRGTISIPVNLIYRFKVFNSDIVMAPYIGHTLKYNFLAKETDTRVVGSGKNATLVKTELNLFDEDDMGDERSTANHIQMAWQFGIDLYIGKICFGIGYGTDLVDFLKSERFSTTYMTLGMTF